MTHPPRHAHETAFSSRPAETLRVRVRLPNWGAFQHKLNALCLSFLIYKNGRVVTAVWQREINEFVRPLAQLLLLLSFHSILFISWLDLASSTSIIIPHWLCGLGQVTSPL